MSRNKQVRLSRHYPAVTSTEIIDANMSNLNQNTVNSQSNDQVPSVTIDLSSLPLSLSQSPSMNLPIESDYQSFSQRVLERLDEAKEEDYIRESIKDSSLDSLSEVKESITAARKHKMRVVEHYLCDSCDKLIEKPTQGFVIQGNIFVADPKTRGGLIGNNFPEPDVDDKIEMSSVRQSVLCKECFCRALGIENKQSNSSAYCNKKDYHSYLNRRY